MDKVKSIIDKINQSKYIKAGIGIVITSVIALCLVLYIGNIYNRNKEDKTILVDDIAQIGDYSSSVELLDDNALKNEIVQLIYAGTTECVEIDGRYFVIISTGGESASDLIIKEEISLDGNYYVYYSLGTKPDGENKLRYRVYEYNAPVIVKEQTISTGTEKNGFINMIVYQVGDKKYAYNPISNETEEINFNYMTGIYLFQYLDNEIVGYDSADSIEIDNCYIASKLSSKLFEVRLPNSATITVSFDELNIETETYQNLLIKYENGFKANIKGEY